MNDRVHPLVQFIELHRKLEGITGAELCKRAGIDEHAYSHMKIGETKRLELKQIEKLMKVFGYRLKPSPLERK